MAALLIMGELKLQPSPGYSVGDAKLERIRCRRLCEADNLVAEGFNAKCTYEFNRLLDSRVQGCAPSGLTSHAASGARTP